MAGTKSHPFLCSHSIFTVFSPECIGTKKIWWVITCVIWECLNNTVVRQTGPGWLVQGFAIEGLCNWQLPLCKIASHAQASCSKECFSLIDLYFSSSLDLLVSMCLGCWFYLSLLLGQQREQAEHGVCVRCGGGRRGAVSPARHTDWILWSHTFEGPLKQNRHLPWTPFCIWTLLGRGQWWQGRPGSSWNNSQVAP